MKITPARVAGIIFLVLYSTIILHDIVVHRDFYLWDFKTNYYAALAYHSGLDPYKLEDLSQVAGRRIEAPYVYPPHALLFYWLFLGMGCDKAALVFLVFKCAFLAGLVYLWATVFLACEIDLLFYWFCIFAFNSALYIDLSAGNISILEQCLVWLGFACFLRGKMVPFCILIILSSTFRLVEMAFILLLLFADDRRKYALIAGSYITMALIMVASYFYNPHLIHGFIQSASQRIVEEGGIFNPSIKFFIMDLSKILYTATGIAVSPALQRIIYALIICAALQVLYMAWGAVKSRIYHDRGRIIILLSCVVYLIGLPYCADYWFAYLIVPTYFIARKKGFGKGYPLFLILASLSSRHITLPGLNVVANLFWEYYPLLLAFYIGGCYLQYIFKVLHSDCLKDPPENR